MVSKNNIQEKIRKTEEKREHHSIRKFAAGAASVLIGLSFIGMRSQTVKADTAEQTEVATEMVQTNTQETENTETTPVEQPEATEKKETNTTDTTQTVDSVQTETPSESTAAPAEPATDSNVSDSTAEQPVQTEDAANQVATQAAKTTKATQPTNKDKVNSANSSANKDLQDAIDKAQSSGVTVNVNNKKPINVSTKDDLDKKIEELKQLNDAEINKILAALAEHEAKMEKYKNDLAAYEKARDEYIETLKKLGLWVDGEHIDPSELKQLLILGKENATVTVENLAGDKVAQGTGSILNGLLGHFWEVKENISGDFLKVTYTNLTNSTYAGKKISKIVVTYSDFVISNHSYQSGRPAAGIYFGNSPTDGFFYVKCNGVTMNLEMYDEAGNLITLGENTAYITVGSLNNGSSSTKYPEYVEKAEILSGGNGIALPESSILVHQGPNGDILYADKDNEAFHTKTPTAEQIRIAKELWGEEIVNKYLGWDDSADRSHEIFGSGLFQVIGGNIKIRFSNELGSAWATFSTTVPKMAFEATRPEAPVTTVEVNPSELKLNSNVYIHYVDVHDEAMKGTTEFFPHHGTELTDKMHAHTDREVGSIYNTALWDWTSANYILAAAHGPEVVSGTVTDDDQHHYIYLKRDVETISRDKVVKQIIHYVYQDGSKAFDDHVSVELKFTQTGYRDKVTGEEVWNGEWTPTQTFVTVTSPTLAGYTADRLEVGPYEITVTNENFAQNLDQEDTVVYTPESQPTEPEQPANPTNPTNPTTPEQPTLPGSPTDPQPTNPEEPTPVLPENPDTPVQPDEEVTDSETPESEETTDSVAPKPETANVKSSENKPTLQQTTAVQKEEQAGQKVDEETLPQTGEGQTKASWLVGIAAALGLLGLAGGRKRQKK